MLSLTSLDPVVPVVPVDRRAAGSVPALDDLLDGGLLEPVFQPVVSLSDGTVRGIEAYLRGPRGSAVREPAALFAAARDRAGELDQAGRRAIAAVVGEPGSATELLFLNVEPLWLTAGTAEDLLDVLRAMSASHIAVEVGEQALLEQPALVLRLAAEVRRLGHLVSLDDVGTDQRVLELLAVLEPDILKLDAGVLADPDSACVAGVLAYAGTSGSVVVAKGIEQPADLDTARRLGAAWGQGWLLGRPGSLPDAAGAGPAASAEAVATVLPPPRTGPLSQVPVEDGQLPGAWVSSDVDWVLQRAPRPARRRSVRRTLVRLVLPAALSVLAFPNLALLIAQGLVRPHAGFRAVALAVLCAVLSLCSVRARRPEPDVHDRALDRIIGVPLLAVAVWLSVRWSQGTRLRAPVDAHELVAAVSFFAGAAVLVWGTRMFLRQRWALLALLVGGLTVSTHPLVLVPLAALAAVAGLREGWWRLRRRPRATDDRTRIAAAFGPAASRTGHRYPPAMAAVLVLAVVAFGLTGARAALGGHVGPVSVGVGADQSGVPSTARAGSGAHSRVQPHLPSPTTGSRAGSGTAGARASQAPAATVPPGAATPIPVATPTGEGCLNSGDCR